MRIFKGNINVNPRVSLIAAVIFVLTVGCGNFSISQSDRTLGQLNPDPTSSLKSTTPQAKTSQEFNSAIIPPTGTLTVTLPEDITWKMLGEINFDRALTDLKRLTGEEQICTTKGCYTIKNRITGSEGLRWAKDYLFQELTKLGYSVSFKNWSSSGHIDQNLIAQKLGVIHPEEKIFFVAHIDGVNSPAADDDASGVVDLLELARVLSSYSFDRTIVLFFSTGEEQGTLGVKSYLSQITSAELASIKYVIAIDMVGYDGNNDRVMELYHGNHAPSIALAQLIKDTIQTYQIDLVPLLEPGCG